MKVIVSIEEYDEKVNKPKLWLEKKEA